MADHGRPMGERVYCYQCNNEWDRSQGGLECPRCHSEFTEILERPTSPPTISSPDHPLHDLHDHNPWDNDEFPDPDEPDINTVRFDTRLGNGTISFTSRTYTSRGSPFGNRPNDRVGDEVGQNFATLLESIMGMPSPTQDRRRGSDPFPPMAPRPRDLGRGRPVEETDFPPSPFAPMFSAIVSAINNIQPTNQGQGGNFAPHPIILLQHLLNPQNAAHGDAVFTQEALDRVITQLMEQNSGSNAPGPASEADIQALPKGAIESSMLGSDGKAECSICMENVDLGEEVTFLPCKHWFHESCVVAWLKEHDTCPHCRASITAKPPNQGETSQGQPESGPVNNHRRYSRRRSSTAIWTSSPESSRRTPFVMPEQSTQDGGVGGGGANYERSSRPYPSRRQSRAESNRSGSNSGNGVTGWLRNHNPFGSGNS